MLKVGPWIWVPLVVDIDSLYLCDQIVILQ